MTKAQKLFSVTISAKRKPGMSEDDYHTYVSEKHAGHLKELLVQKKILDYTMQHNTTELMDQLDELFPNLPGVNRSNYDAYVTMVFRDKQDYINVKNDPHFMQVVNPDHKNFADAANTVMSFGWFEKHVADGKLVQE